MRALIAALLGVIAQLYAGSYCLLHVYEWPVEWWTVPTMLLQGAAFVFTLALVSVLADDL